MVYDSDFSYRDGYYEYISDDIGIKYQEYVFPTSHDGYKKSQLGRLIRNKSPTLSRQITTFKI